MLYLDSHDIPLADLQRFGVPSSPPWESENSRWKPIPHDVVAKTVLQEAEHLGLVALGHQWDVRGEGHDLFGSIDFVTDAGDLPPGLGLSIGIRHSNRGRYALSLAFGGRVFVCSNGLFIGEHILSRRHTTGLDLTEAVRSGLHSYLATLGALRNFVLALRARELFESDVDLLLARAARRGVLSWSGIGKVDKEWREPRHDEFLPRTAWSLYNAFTEVIKQRSPPTQFRSFQALTSLFEDEGLALPQW